MSHSEGPRPVEKEDLFRLKFLQAGALSPDGTRVVYGVAQVDAEKEEETVRLWLLSLETGEARPLTSGLAKDSAPAWSPTGDRIAFVSTRAEKPQIYVIPVDGGEASALTSLKQGVGGGPVWSPDGKFIAFTAGRPVDPPDPAKPYRVTRHIYRFDGVGYLDQAVQELYVIPAEGGEPRPLTDDLYVNSSPRWSPDGTEILYLASMAPDSHRGLFSRLRVVTVSDGQTREVVGDWGAVYEAQWLPDSQRIAFVGVSAAAPIGSKADLWVIDARGGEPECRTAGLKVGVGGGLQPDMPIMQLQVGADLQITADGAKAFITVQEGGAVHIYAVALEGAESWAPVVTGERACFLLGLSADGQSLLYAASTMQNPVDLYLCDVEGARARRLTDVNAEALAGLLQPEVERLLFAGSDGVQVEGWLVKPTVGEPPYPTVLYIHGGPHSAFGHIYHFDTQMLAGAGYAVLLINHRASTGYGDEFSTAIRGDWGNLDYHDLMAGVDYAIARGLADPDRLGVCGLSGGGNLSCWIVGQTGRFKAAVPENPVTNFASMYGVSDIGAWFAVEQLGGHPWEVREVYARCSPITYAHRCTTPTLLIQSEHDWRCPAEQSEQFYTVLKAVGCVVEMLRLPASSHVGSIAGAPIMRRTHNDALLDWMDRYVLGKEASTGSTAQDAPGPGAEQASQDVAAS